MGCSLSTQAWAAYAAGNVAQARRRQRMTGVDERATALIAETAGFHEEGERAIHQVALRDNWAATLANGSVDISFSYGQPRDGGSRKSRVPWDVLCHGASSGHGASPAARADAGKLDDDELGGGSGLAEDVAAVVAAATARGWEPLVPRLNREFAPFVFGTNGLKLWMRAP